MPALENLANPDMLHAIWLTVLIALITVPVNLVFGTLLAWLVTRFNFPGRQLLLTLLDIPFAVSPVVAGLVYLLFYGSNGPLGGWLDEHNLQVMFAWPGMVLVTVFVTCPFVVRELVPVMLSQGSNEDEAAILLGASGWQMFRRVTLPNIRWALLYGVVLTNARAIGEFGAVSVVSGSIRGETLSLPLQIELLEQDYNTVGSFTAAALLTLMAILTLFLKSVVQWRLENQENVSTRREIMSIEIANIKKSFGRTQVLNDISLDIPSGQMVALLGPSGSGKTTLLRIIAGLEHQTSGHIRFHGTDVSRLHARDRKVGFVFQHYALFRHMTVFDNIAFGLTVLPRRERPDAATIKAKVTKLLEMVQLAHLADRFPAQLSGGQKQRVALARALAVEPQILLLDEPFGALDAQVRKELRRWLRQLHEELKFTSVFVTHDQEEAMEVADRVVVMSQGNIEQVDEPEQLWREPATRFVLEFMGEVNRLQGTIRGGQFHVGAHRWPLGYTSAHQGPVDLFLRPWEVDVSRRTSLDSPLPVQVLEASPKGHYTQLVVQPLGWYTEPLTVVMRDDEPPYRGERLFVGLQHARIYHGNERIETREDIALAESA